MGFGSFTSEDAEVVYRLSLYYIFRVYSPTQQRKISVKSTVITRLQLYFIQDIREHTET